MQANGSVHMRQLDKETAQHAAAKQNNRRGAFIYRGRIAQQRAHKPEFCIGPASVR